MFKLLIVDDERLDREGIRDQVEWRELCITTVETAKNGFEAINLIEKMMPDILITDIKMPGMTGLQLAEKATQIVPWLKIIFISGFDDFEYVKSALLINAYEYILKPVDTDKLMSALKLATNERVKEKKKEEENLLLVNRVNESKPLLRQKFIRDIIYGTINKEIIWRNVNYLDINIQEGYYIVLLCEIDDYKILIDDLSEHDVENMLESVADTIKQINNDICYMEHIPIGQARYALVLSFNSYIKVDTINESIKDIATQIIDKVKCKYSLSLTIGVGCLVNKIEDLHYSYNDCCQAVAQKMFTGKGTILYYLPKTNILEKKIDIQNIATQLVQCIKTKDMSGVNYFIDYLFDTLETGNIYDSKYVQNCCINIISRMEIALLDMNEQISKIFGENVILWDKLMKFETILDIRQWMKNVFRAVIEYIENKNNKKNRKIVETVMKYVEENYQKEITLKDIASELYYSPNYLGSIFKEEMGQGFAEYVAEFRMKKAAELLKQSHLKMYEVAYSVGYKNISSFINQFKINYNMTPKEFRERC